MIADPSGPNDSSRAHSDSETASYSPMIPEQGLAVVVGAFAHWSEKSAAASSADTGVRKRRPNGRIPHLAGISRQRSDSPARLRRPAASRTSLPQHHHELLAHAITVGGISPPSTPVGKGPSQSIQGLGRGIGSSTDRESRELGKDVLEQSLATANRGTV